MQKKKNKKPNKNIYGDIKMKSIHALKLTNDFTIDLNLTLFPGITPLVGCRESNN